MSKIDTTKPVEPVTDEQVISTLENITCPAAADFVRQQINALDAANAEIERLTKERDEAEDRANRFATKEMHTERRALKAESESAALVAAAFEAVALHVEGVCSDIDRGWLPGEIRNRTPADATAALEARDAAKVREGWEAGMRTAALACHHEINKDPGDWGDAFLDGVRRARDLITAAILAAIKEKQP